MPIEKGTRIDGIASVEDLKGRCVLSKDSDCWHLRSARGKPLARGRVQRLWTHTHGIVTATQAAWLLSHPKGLIPDGWLTYRTCDSYDCVCPAHVTIGSYAMWGKHLGRTGKASTPAKRAANARMGPTRSVLTAELRQWLLESQQSAVAAGEPAIGSGCCARPRYQALAGQPDSGQGAHHHPGKQRLRPCGEGLLMLVTLIDGSQVDSASEDWRHECEARMVAGRRSLNERREYLEEVEKERGKPAADRLRETMQKLWEVRSGRTR